MVISEFIARQAEERRDLLSEIHKSILESDHSVMAEVEHMMRKEMIVYKAGGFFKYGLSSVKNYMSLHAMPIYASPTLYSKYRDLLKKANFQKGCINFKNEEEMPLNILKQLINDCSEIDLLKIREDYMKSKKSKSSNKQ